MPDDVKASTGIFDIPAIAKSLPDTAKTLLVDKYLTDREQASARVFRVYRPTPPHYHATCDEYLYVVSGRGTFWMKDAATKSEFGPGQLLFFERGTVHAMPELYEEPVVFLSIDTPRRNPTDIIFVDPRDGSPETFMARNAGGAE
ncbi:MAG: cupin domain-containing protein [Afipia sp.]|jgi:mannose-6-phosphate isomerase-like protein (cupin superfamily)|nr:cupin domain-containing protein [Afipia sp.]WIG53637.1 MAG: Cupin:Cupin region [Afipia sp.]